MDWYRRYHGTCADPKLKLVARSANVPTPFAIAAWDAVLEHASAHDDRGSVDGLTGELLAVTIDCAEEQGDALLAAFRKRGLINVEDRVSAWDKRQPGDPTAAERMARKRARDKAAAKDEPPSRPNGPDTRNPRDSVTPERNGVTTRTDQRREESEEETLAPVVGVSPPRARAREAPPSAVLAPDGADDGSESAIVARFVRHPLVKARGYDPEQAMGHVRAWRTRLGHRAEDLPGILAGAMVHGARNPIGLVETELKRREGVAEFIRQERTCGTCTFEDDNHGPLLEGEVER